MNNRKSVNPRASSKPNANKSQSRRKSRPSNHDQNRRPQSPSSDSQPQVHIRRPPPTSKSKSKPPRSSRSPNPFDQKQQKRKRRFRPAHTTLRQIKKLQRSTYSLISKAPFQRIIREVTDHTVGSEYRWTSSALEAIQCSAEDYLVGLFEDAYLCTLHAKRVTLMSQDLYLAKRIRGLDDAGNR